MSFTTMGIGSVIVEKHPLFLFLYLTCFLYNKYYQKYETKSFHHNSAVIDAFHRNRCSEKGDEPGKD